MRIGSRLRPRVGALLIAAVGSLVSCVLVLPGVATTSGSSSGVHARADAGGDGSGTGSGTGAGADARAGVVAGDATAPWAWPTGTRVVGRPWEAPANDYAAGHRGIDVPAALGAGAAAVDDGTVAFAGSVGGRPVVTVDHGDGLVSTLDSVTPTVAAGDVVEQGDVVGTVAVGHCPASAPCLHLGARLDGRYVDPTPYLPAAEWPVLLPEGTWDG